VQASAKPAVVITGASTGIGKTTAMYLADKVGRPAPVLLLSASTSALPSRGPNLDPRSVPRPQGWQVFAGVRSDKAAADLAAAGAGITPLIIDVTQQDSISRALRQVQQQLGPEGLAGLVNNAGRRRRLRPQRSCWLLSSCSQAAPPPPSSSSSSSSSAESCPRPPPRQPQPPHLNLQARGS
jgi:NAD(P)-dependent dehydrogenase (short-subunit alcohol dehydrogenase family)